MMSISPIFVRCLRARIPYPRRSNSAHARSSPSFPRNWRLSGVVMPTDEAKDAPHSALGFGLSALVGFRLSALALGRLSALWPNAYYLGPAKAASRKPKAVLPP